MFSQRLVLSLSGATALALMPGVAGAAPVSRAGATFLAYPGDTVVLDGSASEGNELAWRWVQIGGPRVASSGTDTARPRFRADVPGRYTFELVVWEGDEASSPDTVDVVVADPRIAERYLKPAGCSQGGAAQQTGTGILTWAWWLPMLVVGRRKQG